MSLIAAYVPVCSAVQLQCSTVQCSAVQCSGELGTRLLGEVAVLGRLEEAVQGAAIVIEAVLEELEVSLANSA